MTRRPYSESACHRCYEAGGISFAAAKRGMEAAHDRQELGMDASARIGDILDEVCALLSAKANGSKTSAHSVAAGFLLQEFEADGDWHA